MPKYQLTCECGQQHLVETTQAGETLPCACGRVLTVPTLRVLRTLPSDAPKESSAAGPQRGPQRWTAWHGWATAGLLLAMFAGYFVYYFSGTIVKAPETSAIQASMEKNTPEQNWMLWVFVREGLHQPLDPETTERINAQSERVALRRTATVFTSLGLLLAVVGGAMAMRRPKPAPRRR